MLWSDDFRMVFLWKTERLICCEVHLLGGGKAWNLLEVYGTFYNTEKENFWNSLEELVSNWKEPWLILGDLNEMVNSGKKFGEKLSATRIWFLNDFMQSMGALDLGFKGKKSLRKIGKIAGHT